jgi:hypothetical protein
MFPSRFVSLADANETLAAQRDHALAANSGCWCYFLFSFAAAFGSAGCGRRKVVAVAGAFLSAFGFFSSRPLPPRPLANTVLLFDPNCGRRYGVCFSALLVMA